MPRQTRDVPPTGDVDTVEVPEITSRQGEVLALLAARAARRPAVEVCEREIGHLGALARLHYKGYITITRSVYGPSGFLDVYWRPTDLGWAASGWADRP